MKSQALHPGSSDAQRSSGAMPDVLYHGTNHAFEHFDARHLGRSCDNPTTQFGFFFTESRLDALSWAQRASERRRAPAAPRVVTVHLSLNKVKTLSAAQFHHYLQKARPATIARHLQQWQDQGYDGMTVMREGIRWFAAFAPVSITILSGEAFGVPFPRRDGQAHNNQTNRQANGHIHVQTLRPSPVAPVAPR